MSAAASASTCTVGGTASPALRLATSDTHARLTDAISANLPGHQPAAVPHPIRGEPHERHPGSMGPAVRAMLHSVYDQPDAPAVAAQLHRLIHYLDDKLPDVAEHLREAGEDTLAFTSFE